MISKFTWSINISTGGPLYDFTSSHASYFCHTETHTYTVHRNILVHTAQKHTYTVCFRNTLVHTAQKQTRTQCVSETPLYTLHRNTYTVHRNTLVHTAQKHTRTQCKETPLYTLHRNTLVHSAQKHTHTYCTVHITTCHFCLICLQCSYSVG